MAFKMNNAPFQKETREQRKAANKAYRQSLKKERKDEKALRPYANSKTVDELLGKLADPAKTEKKHTLKKGIKNIATAASVAFGIQGAAHLVDKEKGKNGRWIDRLGIGNPDNL